MENKDQSVGKVIKTLIDVLHLFKKEMRKRATINGQEDYADRYDHIMDTLSLPLYFAWEKYGIGKLDDIMDDWELYLPYQNFKSNIKEHLENLIEGLQEMNENDNVFADMEKDGKVTQGLLTIYKNLLLGVNAGVFCERKIPSRDLLLNLIKSVKNEAYLYPLLYAWEKYKYGTHWDFLEEGHATFDYMMLESKIKDVLPQLIQSLEIQKEYFHPQYQDIISIYSQLVKDLENGTIK